MKKKLLVLLFSLATLGLASCGGSNDIAASGTSAVSAAASTSTTTPTEAKLNGQVDERTGVAPVVAQATIFDPTANGGCGKSSSFNGCDYCEPVHCIGRNMWSALLCLLGWMASLSWG